MAAPSQEIFRKERFYNLHELIEVTPKPPKVEINTEKDLLVLLTREELGPPKGVMITHANADANVYQIHSFMPSLKERRALIAYMPYYHAAGQSVAVFIRVLLDMQVAIVSDRRHHIVYR